MLVNLTPIQSEIDRCFQEAKDHNFDYIPQHEWLIETGIYRCRFDFNFPSFEFSEEIKINDNSIFPNYDKSTYGVADNLEQVKEYFSYQIADTENKYIISLTPVFQHKENRNKCDGWRWSRWGPYIGKLERQFEYLDDEDFGDDFKSVLFFELYKIY